MEKKNILYGAVYHPERYPEDTEKQAEDIRLMRQLHFTAVIFPAEMLSYARITAGGAEWYDRLMGACIAGGLPVIVEVPARHSPDDLIRKLAAQHGVLGFWPKKAPEGEGNGMAGLSVRQKILAEVSLSELFRENAPLPEADVMCFSYNPDWGTGTVQENGRDTGYLLDRIRSCCRGEYYITGIDPVTAGDGMRKRPGILSLEILMAAGSGARGFFFREWRQPLKGPDRYKGAVLDHSGRADSAWAKEIEQTGRLLLEWSDLPSFKIRPGCAVLHTGDAPGGQSLQFYRMLRNLGITVDVIGRDQIDGKYPLIAAPHMPVVTPEEADAVRRFVKEGGTWVACGEFASETEDGVCFEGFPPAGLADVFGISITDRDKLPKGIVMPLKPAADFKGRYFGRDACSLIENRDADVVARYGGGWYKDTPAVTRKLFGRGYAYYLGTSCDEEFLYDILNKIIRGQRKLPRVRIAEDLSMQRLESREAEYILFQNLSERERRLPLDYNRLDIVFGYDPIPTYGSMILKVRTKV